MYLPRLCDESVFFPHVVTVKVYPSQATLSPEVTSKVAPNEEVSTPKKYKEGVIDVKTLTNELAAALLDISAKEDLVKQHSKVAEEAVEGIYCLDQMLKSQILHVLGKFNSNYLKIYM